MFAFFRRMKQARNTIRQKRVTCKPRLEVLEDRIVPTNLITNGSFEAGPSIPTSGYQWLYGGDTTSIPGWTVTGDSIDDVGNTYGNIWDGSDGSRSLDLAGFANGGVQQTFATTPGVKYQVQFDLSGNPADPGKNQPIVKVIGVSAAGQSTQFSFDVTGHDYSDMGWVTENWGFTANYDLTTLAFDSLDDPNSPWGPVLDNVIVTAQPDFRVNSTTAGVQQFPSVAMDANGNSVVVWQSQNQDGDAGGIYAQRYDTNGDAVGSEFQVNTTTAGTQEQPAVAMAPDGSFIVAWEGNGPGDSYGIFAQRFDAAGNPLGNEFKVNTYTSDIQAGAGVAVDTAGDFVITWDSMGQDGDLWGVYGQRYHADGTSVGSEFQVNTTTNSNQDGGRAVAMGPTGNFVVLWQAQTGGNSPWHIYSQRYDANGAPLGGESPVTQMTSGSQFVDSVAMAADGHYAVAFDGSDASGYGVFLRLFDASGNPLSGGIPVNTTTAGDQRGLKVAFDTAGNILVTWQSDGQDGSGMGVYGQYFTSAGVRRGSEFRINTTTSGDQWEPAVAINPEGEALVVWQGNGPGDSDGIFGQRISAPSYIVVTKTTDDGSTGTLRDAINQINAGKYKEIDFNIAGTGVQTINLTSQLPTLTASGVFINGLTQGASGNTSPLIALNGSGAGSSSDGVLLQGSNDIVSGLILEHFNNGIEVAGANNTIGGTTTGTGNVLSGNTNAGLLIDSGASGVAVQGNYIGTNAAGNAVLANSIGIEDAGFNNTIGGGIKGARNIISGNGSDGIRLDSTATAETVQGSFLGLNASGNAALVNGSNGLEVQGSNNTIGGASVLNYYTRNFLSGNTNDGLLIDSGATGNQVLGNFIGLGVSGTQGVGNLNGVEIAGSNNSIGSTTFGNTNFISGNKNDGVLMDSGATGNFILGDDVGTDYTGKNAVGNSGDGIEVMGTGNAVGSAISAAHNIISGNSQDGVLIDSTSSGTLVLGNYIGLNLSGTALSNSGNGVNIVGNNNTLGGTASAARNIISGNSNDGVLLASGASGNQVLGNYIGTNLAGSAAVANFVGIDIHGAGNTIGGTASAARNIISGNSCDGVLLLGSSGNQVLGNYIGTNAAGTVAVANGTGIEDDASDNTIGGSVPGARNVISGNNNYGILLDRDATAETVQSNILGLNAAGNAALANRYGIVVYGSNNTIGGNSVKNYYTRNFLSGNAYDGVLLEDTAAGNQVLGNFIGLDISGTRGAGNLNGIEIYGSNNTIGSATFGNTNFVSGNSKNGVLIHSTGANNLLLGNDIGTDYTGRNAVANSGNGIEVQGNGNTLGGTAAGACNIISGNSQDGVRIDSSASGTLVQGNSIGVNISGIALGNGANGVTIAGTNNTVGGSASKAGNTIANNNGDGVLVSAGKGDTISRNSIFANTGGGIFLSGGGNNNLAAPSLVSATLNGSTLTVQGSFTAATANVPYVLEFFANPSGDAEGKIYLGTLTVTPPSTGMQSFMFSITSTVTGTNPLITATLTDATGDTSAFSNGATVSF